MADILTDYTKHGETCKVLHTEKRDRGDPRNGALLKSERDK
jgi:hypothetical protein